MEQDQEQEEEGESQGEEIAIDNYEVDCTIASCPEKVQIELIRPANWKCTGITIGITCPAHQINGSTGTRRGMRGRGRPRSRTSVRPRGFKRKSATNHQNLTAPAFLGTETEYLPIEEETIEGLVEAVDEAFEALEQFAPEPEPEPEPEPVVPTPPPAQPSGESKVKKRREARTRRVRGTADEAVLQLQVSRYHDANTTLQDEFPDLFSREEQEEEPVPMDPELEMRKKAAQQREIMARRKKEAEREINEMPIRLQIPRDGIIEDMLKKDLMKICKRLGLSSSGNKNNIIKRLKEYRDEEEDD